MSAAKKSKLTTTLGPRFSRDELEELDRQRAKLGTNEAGEPKYTRAGALKLVWQVFGDEAVDSANEQREITETTAEAAQPFIAPLDESTKAWNERAFQRQKIGGNVSQIARYANTLRLIDDGPVDPKVIDDLVAALQGVERALNAQAEAERADGRILDAVREVVDRIKAAS